MTIEIPSPPPPPPPQKEGVGMRDIQGVVSEIFNHPLPPFDKKMIPLLSMIIPCKCDFVLILKQLGPQSAMGHLNQRYSSATNGTCTTRFRRSSAF